MGERKTLCCFLAHTSILSVLPWRERTHRYLCAGARDRDEKREKEKPGERERERLRASGDDARRFHSLSPMLLIFAPPSDCSLLVFFSHSFPLLASSSSPSFHLLSTPLSSTSRCLTRRARPPSECFGRPHLQLHRCGRKTAGRARETTLNQSKKLRLDVAVSSSSLAAAVEWATRSLSLCLLTPCSFFLFFHCLTTTGPTTPAATSAKVRKNI